MRIIISSFCNRENKGKIDIDEHLTNQENMILVGYISIQTFIIVAPLGILLLLQHGPEVHAAGIYKKYEEIEYKGKRKTLKLCALK